jgi:hypothetical protein
MAELGSPASSIINYLSVPFFEMFPQSENCRSMYYFWPIGFLQHLSHFFTTFPSLLQNCIGHLCLETHEIPLSSTNKKWDSSNMRISYKLTLKGGIMLLARMTHHISGHNVMHDLLDLNCCRHAALLVSLSIFPTPLIQKARRAHIKIISGLYENY